MAFVWSLAVKNLRRRKLRTGLTVSGIVVGVGLMLVLLSLTSGMESQARTLIRGLSGADVVVTNATLLRGFRGPSEVPLGPSTLSESILDLIREIPEVYAASPQLSFTAFVDGRRITVYGIEPSTYDVVTGGLNVVEGRSLSRSGEIVLGKALVDLLDIKVGDLVNLTTGQGESRAFEVVGAFETGVSFQEYAGYVTLEDAQELTGMRGTVTQVLIKCHDPSLASQVASTISSSLEGVRAITPTATLERVTQTLNSLTMFFATIGLVALVAGSFGVVNTMMMSVTERTREIGVLKAMGARNRDVMKMFLAESLLIGLMGGCIGIIVGAVLAHVFPVLTAGLFSYGAQTWIRMPMQIGRAPTNVVLATPLLTPVNAAISLALGVLVGLLAGLYPAWRASRMRPVEALRHA